jgi:hypothetical protein
MSKAHYVHKCSCGKVITQCRCASPDKQVTTFQDGCAECKAKKKTGAFLRRTIHPEVKVLDEKNGLVEYIASNATVDSYNESIDPAGWRFDHLDKNAPFVDSHNYESIGSMLGRIVDYGVKNSALVETVKWAIDVPECPMARLGFNMTKAGYLKAVSVGFQPVRMVSRYDPNLEGWNAACERLRLDPDSVRCIYLEQQQRELSACIIGANPDAVAKSYKAGILTDDDLQTLSSYASRATVNPADGPAAAELTRQRARTAFLVSIQTAIATL